MLLDDVELLFAELVGDIQGRAAARGASVGPQFVLLGLEVAGERLTPGGLRLLLRRLLRRGLLGRLGSLLECAPLFALDDGWRWLRRRDRRASLALLALRYGEQLGDALVEPRELLDELSILLGELRELSTELCILLSQRFELITDQ